MAESPESATASSGLFHREPLGFDEQTLERFAGTNLESLPAWAGSEVQMLGLTGSGVVLLLLIASAYAIFARRGFGNRLEALLAKRAAAYPLVLQRFLAATAQVLAAGLLPALLWGLHSLSIALTDFDPPWFRLVGELIWRWVQFALALSVAREILLRPLLPIAEPHGHYLYVIARWILAYAVLVGAGLDSVGMLGVPPDIVAFLRFLFRLTLVLALTIALWRRHAVMALFPTIDNQPYQRFVQVLGRVYHPAVALTATTVVLWLAGFEPLARFVWVCTWALAGLFLAGVLVNYIARGLLRRWILTESAKSESAEAFYASSGRLLDYLSVVAVVLLALDVIGLRGPIVEILGSAMFQTGEREISILLFILAGAIFGGFAIFARVLRDYLDYRVYPALQVEEGVAHAVSTFVFYALLVVGVLFAIEAVGLGLGSLTIFAGAVGIGVGFGLQTLAANLASGLTLIFSRALRKGDWVTVRDTVGVIQEVGIRATRLRTRDAVEYLVPNTEFVAGTIINWTHTTPVVRHHVAIGASYNANPDEVREILIATAKASPLVLSSPAPEVWFTGFGDSSIDFELLVWVNIRLNSQMQMASDLYFRVFRAFEDAGIEIPFPQRDVHIRDARPGSTVRSDGGK